MTDSDVLAAIKEKMREELARCAKEEIEKLAHKFACEMGKHKAELISALINCIEIATYDNPLTQNITFQINIRCGDSL
jgi:hypothetical protein